jgi:benzoyl-CoA-dihydrodiol lyase
VTPSRAPTAASETSAPAGSAAGAAAAGKQAPGAPLRFETDPSAYRHWKLSVEGPVARLGMDVDENEGQRPGYALKLNSYDIGVDIELADAVRRLRFEHPGVKVLVIESLKPRVFCAGANIFMLGTSSHAFKVNFCKFTNETRVGLEDLSAECGIRSLAALAGVCAGGGYELALACDRIVLQDDANSAVSLPEVPLLGVLPGTGGLTRLVDKRKVRRDLADVFSTLAEGIKGARAKEWNLVDDVVPASRFAAGVEQHVKALSTHELPEGRGEHAQGVRLPPLGGRYEDDAIVHRHVTLRIQRRQATILVRGPDAPPPASAADAREGAADLWSLRVMRELDDVLLDLRFNRLEVGLVLLRTEGDLDAVLAHDAFLDANRGDWFVREVIAQGKRTLKRLDLTAKSLYAIVEPGSCFAGTLLELALAADRTYMLDDPERPNAVAVSPMNGGSYPMSNARTRLETRFLGEPDRVGEALALEGHVSATDALEAGLVTLAPDDIDWDDEVRIAIEERASLSPDALTGMEANLRFAGAETMETKIFGRLTAWQNWIFQRPNAVGPSGALTLYGRPERPEFDWRRT